MALNRAHREGNEKGICEARAALIRAIEEREGK